MRKSESLIKIFVEFICPKTSSTNASLRSERLLTSAVIDVTQMNERDWL